MENDFLRFPAYPTIAWVKDNPCGGNQQRDPNGNCRDPA